MTQHRLTDQEKIDAVKKFETGEYSYASLAREYKVTTGAMWALMQRKKVKTPTSGYFCICKRKYTLNEHYFDVIDTEEKAYFLGLLYSDGCHYEKTHSITLNLQEEDKEILDKLQIAINSNRPLFLVEASKKNKKWKNLYRLVINSKHLSKKLSNLGLISKKSLILEFPTEEQVPNHLLRHFIRGYFDGDGSISYWVEKKSNALRFDASIVGTENFCIKFNTLIKEEIGVNTKIKTRYKQSNTSTRSTTIRTKPGVHKFMTWLYDGATIYLRRKFEKYNELKKFEENWKNRYND